MTKPIGVEVERDPGVLPGQFNYCAVRFQSIACAFENASYGKKRPGLSRIGRHHYVP
jgi:hypothetical protein